MYAVARPPPTQESDCRAFMSLIHIVMGVVCPIFVIVHYFPTTAARHLRHRPVASAPAWERGLHDVELALWRVFGGREEYVPNGPAWQLGTVLFVWWFLLSTLCFASAFMAAAAASSPPS